MSLNKFSFDLPNTLSFRLSMLFALTFSIFLLLAFLLTLLLVNNSLGREIDEDLSEDIGEYRKIFNTGGLTEVIDEIKRDIKDSDSEEEFVILLDKAGQYIFSSELDHWKGLKIDRTIIKKITVEQKNKKIILETRSIDKHDYAVRIAYGVIGPEVIIKIGESLEQKADIMELLAILFLVSFLIVILPAFYLGWYITRRSITGIEKVSKAVDEISEGNLDSQVHVNGQYTEIQNLVDAFNSMSRRIKQLIQEMQEMIDNIAHDLRTPLGRIRMISEMTISSSENEDCKSSASRTLEQCDKLLQYINATLDVAEIEAGVSMNQSETVDMSELTNNACELLEPNAELKNIKYKVTLSQGCYVHGSKPNLQRMIANIIDNALKYTPENGEVSIDLAKNDDQIIINVNDSGIGIPEPEQERIFDRFYRCDKSRGEEGCGLGLSFSRAVARAHGGDIILTSSHDSGSRFSISLPVL